MGTKKTNFNKTGIGKKSIDATSTLDVNGDTYVSGDVSFNSNLNVTNQNKLESTLHVGGKTEFLSDVSLNTNLLVAGDVSFNSNLNVTNETILESTLH